MRVITKGAIDYVLSRIQCMRDINLQLDLDVDELVTLRDGCCSSSSSSSSSSSGGEFIGLNIVSEDFPALNGFWPIYGMTAGKYMYEAPAGNTVGSIMWDITTGGGQDTPCFSLFYDSVCSLWSPFSQDVATPDLCVGDWLEWYPSIGPTTLVITPVYG